MMDMAGIPAPPACRKASASSRAAQRHRRLHEGEDTFFFNAAVDCLASLRRVVHLLERTARSLHRVANYSFATIAAFWAPYGMVS